MEFLLSLYTNQFLIFVLVLTRVAGLVVVAPIWSSKVIPVRVRAFLAVGIALIITPAFWHTPIADPENLVNLSVLMTCEFAVGLALGLAVTICFAGMEMAGQILGQMTGMSMADVASPDFDASVPVFSQFLHMLMLAIFVVTGGHQYVLHTFMKIFQQVPPGQTHFSAPMVETLTQITSYSFSMGLRLAAPMMVALMLTILIMGLISRTMPQFNVLAVGFSINSLIMLSVMLLSLGVLARVFQEECFTTIDLMAPVFGNAAFGNAAFGNAVFGNSVF